MSVILRPSERIEALEAEIDMLEDNEGRADTVLDWTMKRVDELKAERDNLLALLRDIERTSEYCPSCSGFDSDHEDGCPLYDVLEDSE